MSIRVCLKLAFWTASLMTVITYYSRREKRLFKKCIRPNTHGKPSEGRENEPPYLQQSLAVREQLTAPGYRHRPTPIMMTTAWLQVLQQQQPRQQPLQSGPAMAHGSLEPSPTDWCWETWRQYFRKTTKTQTSMLAVRWCHVTQYQIDLFCTQQTTRQSRLTDD